VVEKWNRNFVNRETTRAPLLRLPDLPATDAEHTALVLHNSGACEGEISSLITCYWNCKNSKIATLKPGKNQKYPEIRYYEIIPVDNQNPPLLCRRPLWRLSMLVRNGFNARYASPEA
jgi:hypothetical protein